MIGTSPLPPHRHRVDDGQCRRNTVRSNPFDGSPAEIVDADIVGLDTDPSVDLDTVRGRCRDDAARPHTVEPGEHLLDLVEIHTQPPDPDLTVEATDDLEPRHLIVIQPARQHSGRGVVG